MRDGEGVASAGQAALAQGDFAAARAAFEEELRHRESPECHEMLGRLCTILEDLEAARRHSETAYRVYRQEGRCARAAAAAIALVAVHEWEGNEAAVSGWLARAGRLLDEAGPCVERGYLEVARVGCAVRDVKTLEAATATALAIAREFGDTDLEVRALSESGLALVSQGRVAEGLARLDEAMAVVVAGEVRNHVVAGLASCSMLHACDRLGDLERATQWIEAAETMTHVRFGSPVPMVLQSHCRLLYGGLLGELGRWEEAEAQLRRALTGTRCLGYQADASARIAMIRIRQGRLDDAAELLAGFEDRVEATAATARLHMARGEPAAAAAVLRRALRVVRNDLLSSAPLLALLVEVEAAHGAVAAAAAAAAELGALAEECSVSGVWTLARLSAGRVAGARGEDAVPHLHAALEHLAARERPMLRAEIQLELAGALRDADRDAAVAEARAALAMFDRLGARESAGRAAALLRALGVAVRTAPSAVDTTLLSRREQEVLALVAEGLSNAEIGARLFITAKTVEHHVGAILGKLNLRSRAQAAAYAASRRVALPAG